VVLLRRVDDADVPHVAVRPRHAGEELRLDMIAQLLNRAADDLYRAPCRASPDEGAANATAKAFRLPKIPLLITRLGRSTTFALALDAPAGPHIAHAAVAPRAIGAVIFV
jgi:hypothetical protein